jgi:hypothetical protein
VILHVEVSDVDAAVRRATAGGATVLHGPATTRPTVAVQP